MENTKNTQEEKTQLDKSKKDCFGNGEVIGKKKECDSCEQMGECLMKAVEDLLTYCKTILHKEVTQPTLNGHLSAP